MRLLRKKHIIKLTSPGVEYRTQPVDSNPAIPPIFDRNPQLSTPPSLVMDSFYLSPTWTRAKAFQRAQEMISWLQKSRQWQIHNLEDHASDVGWRLARKGNDPEADHQYHVTYEQIHTLMEDWCGELNRVRLEYARRFAPLTKQEIETFDEAVEVATTLSRGGS